MSLTGPKPVVAPAEVTEPDTRYSHLEEVKTALDSEVAGKQPVQKTTPDAVKEEGEVLTGEVPNDSAGTSTKSRVKSNEYSNSPLKDDFGMGPRWQLPGGPRCENNLSDSYGI